MTKIINLSLQRSGTQTLYKLLKDINLPGIHHITQRNHSKNYHGLDLEKIAELIEEYEDDYVHFSDAPYFMMYKYFDKKYPKSKFILVKRKPELWLASFKKLYSILPIDPVSRAAFSLYIKEISAIKNNEMYKISDSQLLKMYVYHNLKIEKYFKNKNNLLIINIEELNNPERISSFLGVSIKDERVSSDFLRKIISEEAFK
jgi:hypothetical protein